MKRPIIPIVLIYLFSIIVIEYLNLNLSFYIFMLIISILILFSKRKYFIFYILIFSIFILFIQIRFPTIKINFNNKHNFIARVYEKIERDYSNEYHISAISKDYINGKNLVLKTKEKLNIGDTIEVDGEINEPFSSNNYNVFNNRKFYKSKNIFYEIINPKINIISSEKSIKTIVLEKIKENLDINLVPKYSALLKSMIVGDRVQDEFSDYKELGLAHVLAISGLHLNIIISILDKLGRSLGIKKKIYAIFVVMVLILYGYITSFPISLIRALSMYVIGVICIHTNNIKDDLNQIFVSLFIALLINPYFIYNVGFYLSYASIFALKYISNRLKMIFRNFSEEFIYLISIQITLFPLMIYYFNTVNLLSIFINILAIPIISIGLMLGFALVVFDNIILGYIINNLFYLVDLLLEPFRVFNELFTIKLSFSIRDVVLFYVFLTLILNYKFVLYKMKKLKITYLDIMVLVYILKIVLLPTTIINFIDVGQGDAVMIRSRNYTMLYDVGGNPLNTESSGKKFYDYLIKNKVYKIDDIFVSHPDLDHMGNLEYLLKNMEVSNIYNGNLDKYKSKAIKEGDKFNIGDINIDVLYDGSNSTSSNDSSKVLIVEIYGIIILLTGDIEEAEKYIVYDKSIDFLKVSHHGGKKSTTHEFLENNKIKNAIISSGLKNRYGHPSKEVLNRLSKKNIEIYRTDLDGNVEIRINRFGYFVHTYRTKYDLLDVLRLLWF